ncbi:MAG: PLP-dependent aminotransferase family protein [Eubacterium sp.]|nr:PLP-dependent aminotransferase family protein [Eubacterium sp.]
MLSYSFHNKKGSALYEQLYSFIRNDIISGILPPKTRLPSKRSFAANLGISTITVENAYAQLLSEGYIFSIPKKGYYVSDIILADNSKEAVMKRAGGPEGAAGLSRTGPGYPGADAGSAPEGGSVFADFTSNQTRPENFPFSVWARIVRKVLTFHDKDLMTRSPGGGIYGLRRAIAGHLRQFRGINVAPEQIIVGAGTEYLYGLLIQLLGFDKSYAIENPGYEKIAMIYDSYQVKKHYIDMDHHGIRIDQLRDSGADVLHISPSHHFPTGIITPVSRRYKLLKWAGESDSRYIIEDDYDSEFRLLGKPIPAMQSIDHQQKVIYINTFSKTLSSTMRISYMVLPMELLKRFQAEMGFYSCTVPNFEQYSLMLFIDEGHFEKHINRTRKYYHKQRDHLLSAIKKSPLASEVTITEEDAGLHFLMKLNTDIPDDMVIRKAESLGIRLNCLSNYYVNAPEDAGHIFIINYSFIEPERIEEAVDRIYRCLT